jgi:hypothetical protein
VNNKKLSKDPINSAHFSASKYLQQTSLDNKQDALLIQTDRPDTSPTSPPENLPSKSGRFDLIYVVNTLERVLKSSRFVDLEVNIQSEVSKQVDMI